MCGLTGCWGPPAGVAALEARGRAMADAVRHRGPDDAGVWVDAARGLVLAHRRLSILDLSPDGHQPMVGEGGRLVLVYNGEVYNYRALRAELEAEGARFRSGTDTEVVLRGFERWGVEPTLRRLVGMFALALFDTERGRLTLARDRLGIKPLYHGCVPAPEGGEAVVLFGSEPKALRAHPAFPRELDRDVVALYLRYACVPHPYSVHRGLAQLSPGALVEYEGRGPAQERRWWDAREVALAARAAPFRGDAEEAADAVEAALAEAVSDRLVADVPLGAFLSGGIDSSLVVALMQRAAGRPVDTFTIGFEDERFDEAGPARAVAAHLGTRHHERTVTAAEAQAVVPLLPTIWDEPFADASQVPTYVVSRFAREHVTVALSGDGGDELCGGYTRYFRMQALARRLGRVPARARGPLGALLERSPGGLWETLARWVPGAARAGLTPGRAAHKVARLGEVLRGGADGLLYRSLVSHWKRPAELVPGAVEPPSAQADPRLGAELPLLERLMLVDTVSYLPDDILTKVDRASMAVSLEARVPLLDHRVFELLWSLPGDVRVGPSPGKAVLRRVLARHVPAALFDRPKQGFGVPMGAWLRGPLRDWAEALLAPERLAAGDLLAPAPVRAVWRAHLEGPVDWGAYLWDVLALQAWRERWGHG